MIYRGIKWKEISFPLGGIVTGSVGLAGNGALIDWEIFNRPNNGYRCFAIKATFSDGKSVIKILQGDHIKDFSGQHEKATKHNGFGYGPATNTYAGFPALEM